MRQMNEILLNSNFETDMKHELYSTFGENDFSNALYTIIDEIIDDYVSFDYHTWLYGDDETIDNSNITRYTSYVHRWLMKKYKYIEFFKSRWDLENGTMYGDRETKNRILSRDRELQVNNTRDYNNTHTSSTDMDYTSNASGTDNTDNSTFNMSENAPLGADETITTPYGKDKSTSSVDNTTSTERTDTQDISVNSSDVSKDTLNSQTVDGITDTENETKTYENGVEILKAMKYNNLSIMDVLQDIMDRTVYEFNVVM